MVSPTAGAVATATSGTAAAFAGPNPLIGFGLIGAGIAVPVVAYYGFADDDRRRVGSPSN
jgi:hypothetical protein